MRTGRPEVDRDLQAAVACGAGVEDLEAILRVHGIAVPLQPERPRSEVHGAILLARREPINRRTRAKAKQWLAVPVREHGHVYHTKVRNPASAKKGGEVTRKAHDPLRQQNIRLFEETRRHWPRLTVKQLCSRVHAAISESSDFLQCNRKTLNKHVRGHLVSSGMGRFSG